MDRLPASSGFRVPRGHRALLLALALFGAACGRGAATGPAEVAWDRDTCERCAMAIGDRRFAAQIRSGASGEVHKFDDLGCASLWLDEHGREAGDRPEIWVRDLRGERWVDATAAHYTRGLRTPMNFGFGASAEPVDGGSGWSEVRERVREMERARRSPGR